MYKRQQLGGSYAAAYKAQPTHDAKTLVSLLPKPGVDAPRFTLINGCLLYTSQMSATARMDTQAQRVNTTCMTPSCSVEVIS